MASSPLTPFHEEGSLAKFLQDSYLAEPSLPLTPSFKAKTINLLNLALCGYQSQLAPIIFDKQPYLPPSYPCSFPPFLQSHPSPSMTPLPEYKESQRGKVCGHIFGKGEAIYRCHTCALDDTCVLCSQCFKSTHNREDPNYCSDDHDIG